MDTLTRYVYDSMRYFARALYFVRFYTEMFRSVLPVFRSLNLLSLTPLPDCHFMSVDVNTSYKNILARFVVEISRLRLHKYLQDVECVLCVLAT